MPELKPRPSIFNRNNHESQCPLHMKYSWVSYEDTGAKYIHTTSFTQDAPHPGHLYLDRYCWIQLYYWVDIHTIIVQVHILINTNRSIQQNIHISCPFFLSECYWFIECTWKLRTHLTHEVWWNTYLQTTHTVEIEEATSEYYSVISFIATFKQNSTFHIHVILYQVFTRYPDFPAIRVTIHPPSCNEIHFIQWWSRIILTYEQLLFDLLSTYC